jgi:hypothetical protein
MRYHRLNKLTSLSQLVFTVLLYYKRTLRLDRKLKDVREKIIALEKERKK